MTHGARLHRFLLSAFGAACLAGSAAAQAVPAGPLSGVGILKLPVGSCTAVLVGTDEVLTAAHCMGKFKNEDLSGSGKIFFKTGAYPGRPSQEFGVASFTAHPLYFANIETGYLKIPYDLALLKLKIPVPQELASPIPIAEPELDDEKFVVASWRDHTAPRPRQRMCDRATMERFLTLHCHVQKGESGSPVLRLSESGPQIVAIVTNSIDTRHIALALSAPVAPRIGQLRALLPVQ